MLGECHIGLIHLTGGVHINHNNNNFYHTTHNKKTSRYLYLQWCKREEEEGTAAINVGKGVRMLGLDPKALIGKRPDVTVQQYSS